MALKVTTINREQLTTDTYQNNCHHHNYNYYCYYYLAALLHSTP